MVKIEINGSNVYTEADGAFGIVCVDALLAMNGIYCHIAKDRPDKAGLLRYLITQLAINGSLFEDHDESGVLDDIPETATKSRP